LIETKYNFSFEKKKVNQPKKFSNFLKINKKNLKNKRKTEIKK
jgi:hypothetical protein